MKIKRITLFLLVAILVVGCATPTGVKQLSSELVKINESYYQSLEAYFKIIDDFVDDQVKLAGYLIDELDKEYTEKNKKLALQEYREGNQDTIAVLDEFGDLLTENVQESAKYKAELDELKAQLKSKNAELLSIQAGIKKAQEKLNEYIVMEKAPEAALNELYGVIGIEMGNVKNTMGEIKDLFGRFSIISESIGESVNNK